MKVIVAGGRDFVPKKFDYLQLSYQLGVLGATEVVCGMAKGADEFGRNVADCLRIPVKKFPADWEKHGSFAGPLRNEKMACYADALIAYPGGRGTENMKKQAMENGVKIIMEMGKP